MASEAAHVEHRRRGQPRDVAAALREAVREEPPGAAAAREDVHDLQWGSSTFSTGDASCQNYRLDWVLSHRYLHDSSSLARGAFVMHDWDKTANFERSGCWYSRA